MQIKGIDLSEHNTRRARVNFKAVRESGVDFVLIRAGWCGYEGGLDVDDNLDQTIRDALKVGVDVGLYVYSYAASAQAARVAARELVGIARRYTVTYPLIFDVEETTDSCLLSQGKQALTDTIIAFCEEIQALGYYAMWYTYSAFVQQYLDYSRLRPYDFWQADYRAKPWAVQRGIWQYIGDDGVCPGVNGPCDRNYAYKDYPSLIRSAGLNGFGKTDSTASEENNIGWEALRDGLISAGYTGIKL